MLIILRTYQRLVTYIPFFCDITCSNQYHGGTNFGRSAGGPYIATTYDYDAPLDEYGNEKLHYSYANAIA